MHRKIPDARVNVGAYMRASVRGYDSACAPTQAPGKITANRPVAPEDTKRQWMQLATAGHVRMLQIDRSAVLVES